MSDILRQCKIRMIRIGLSSAPVTGGPPDYDALVRLITSGADVTTLTNEQVVLAVKSTKQASKNAQGRAADLLHDRGWTWEQVGDAFGVNQSTAFRWAMDYRARFPQE